MFLDFPANTETAHIIESKYLYSIKVRLASQLFGFNQVVHKKYVLIETDYEGRQRENYYVILFSDKVRYW